MNVGGFLEQRRFIRCMAALMALVLIAPPMEAAIAAQDKDASKETQKSTGKSESPKASLRIEVLVADPDKKDSPQRVENATVKIHGEEESHTTGRDGRTESFTVPPGTKTVVIHASSVTCSVDISVKEGRHDVKVLVEKQPQLKCTLQP
jgi:hypothetical protein